MDDLELAPATELIRSCQRGDRQAFDRLVQQEHGRIHRLVHSIMGNREELDDLVQEIFVRLYRKIGTFRFESRFSTWLTRLAVNECRKALRRRQLSRLLFGTEPEREDSADSTLRVLEREEEHEFLRRAVESLPEKQRLVVILRYFETLSCEEIATVLECKVGTVRSRLFNARQQLKDTMLDYENG